MAQNLRAKAPQTDTLIIHDQNREVVRKFKEEVGIAAAGAGVEGKAKGIEVAESPREVAEKSVCAFSQCPDLSLTTSMMSMFHTNDLSWGAYGLFSRDSILTSKPIL